MQIIVDSGATKALWAAVTDGAIIAQIYTPGISPYYLGNEEIIAYIKQVRGELGQEPEALFFYGTGCNSREGRKRLTSLFQKQFPAANPVQVEVDILGATRAVCGRKPGIASILGTGSNVCSFDGEKVVDNIGGLGYILGDEGSGASMGRLLLSAYFNRQLPDVLAEKLEMSYDLDRDAVLDQVYKNSTPSRYLASFAPFLKRYREHPYIQKFLHAEFSRFCRNNLMMLDHYRELPIHFIGSIAFHFRKEVEEVLLAHQMQPGNFLIDPIEGLVSYHRERV